MTNDEFTELQQQRTLEDKDDILGDISEPARPKLRGWRYISTLVAQ